MVGGRGIWYSGDDVFGAVACCWEIWRHAMQMTNESHGAKHHGKNEMHHPLPNQRMTSAF